MVTEVGGFSVTYKNQGTAAAGPFNVTVNGYPPIRSAGLAPGASETRQSGLPGCPAGDYHAMVDSSFEVAESNENNNTRDGTTIC